MRVLALTIAMVCVGAIPFTAAQQGKKEKGKAPKSEALASVTLTKRKDNGEYGTSAYSFRYMTQDGEVHKNDVDLLFNGCGLLHVTPSGGLKNRIVKLDAASTGEKTALPEQGWLTECFEPEKGATYVMEIDDDSTRMRVRIHVTSVSAAEVKFDWAPFRDPARAAPGAHGQCGGKHDPR